MNGPVLRRSILQWLKQVQPTPQTAKDLAENIYGGAGDADAITEAGRELLTAGYVSNVNPAGDGAEHYYRITAAGQAQLLGTVKRDFLIWGRLAV